MNESELKTIKEILVQKGRKFEVCKELFSSKEIISFSSATLYKKLLLILNLKKAEINERSFRKWHAKEKSHLSSKPRIAHDEVPKAPIINSDSKPDQLSKQIFNLTDPSNLHRNKQSKYLNLNIPSNDKDN